jgi:molybdopterin/thiamine biosynthesis adenylyltransferase
VRQPFTDDDVGKAKAEVLADQLRAIRPGLDIMAHVADLNVLLDRDDWHSDADVIIDCSANVSVQTKLELIAREFGTSLGRTPSTWSLSSSMPSSATSP